MATNPVPESSTKHTVIASWVFGSLLLVFYMGVFAFAPNELPPFKHKMLAIFSALLCGLFTFFFVGSLKVTLNFKNKWTKLAIQSGGGAAAFVLILWWWNNPDFAPIQRTPIVKQKITSTDSSSNTTVRPLPTQVTKGNQSPAIVNNGSGDVNVQYVIPQKVETVPNNQEVARPIKLEATKNGKPHIINSLSGAQQ